MDELYANNPVKVEENEVSIKEAEERKTQIIVCPWCEHNLKVLEDASKSLQPPPEDQLEGPGERAKCDICRKEFIKKTEDAGEQEQEVKKERTDKEPES